MARGKFSQTSFFLQAEKRAVFAWQQSFARVFTARALDRLKTHFKGSFLGRISNIGDSSMVLQESKVAEWITKRCRKSARMLGRCVKMSVTSYLSDCFLKDSRKGPLQRVAVIAVIIIMINSFTFIVLGWMTLWSGLMRCALLFAAAAILFSNADWPAVKESSLALRLILRNRRCAGSAEK